MSQTKPYDEHEQHLLSTTLACQVHTTHIPYSHINEIHHVWPKGEGGPAIADNMIVVCATGHNNIHQLIRELKAARGTLPYSVLRRYAFKEREYAQLGYARLTRKAM